MSSMEIVPFYAGPASVGWNTKIGEHEAYLQLLAKYVSGTGTPAGFQTTLQQYGFASATVAPSVFERSGGARSITRAEALGVITTAQTQGLMPAFASNRLLLLALSPGYSISDAGGQCAFHASNGPGQIYAVVTADCPSWLLVTGLQVFGAALNPQGDGWDEPDGCPFPSNVLSRAIPAIWDNRNGGGCAYPGQIRSPTAFAVGPTFGYVRHDKTSTVLFKTQTNGLGELTLAPTVWYSGDLLTAATGGPPPVPEGQASAFARPGGRTSVLYRTASGGLHELRLTGWNWEYRNLSDIAHATPVANDPIGYVREDGVSSIVYKDWKNHITELTLSETQSLGTDGQWSVADLTDITQSPIAGSAPSVFVRSDATSSVVYRGTDLRIYELRFVDGAWRRIAGVSDVTREARGRPAPYVNAEGDNRIAYRDASGQIAEIGLINNRWQRVPVSSNATGAPFASGDPFAYVRSDGSNAIVYQSGSHIWELSRPFGTTAASWSAGDLTQLSGSAGAIPAGISSSVSAYVRSDGLNVVVFKREDDNRIGEIRLQGSSWLPGTIGGP